MIGKRMGARAPIGAVRGLLLGIAASALCATAPASAVCWNSEAVSAAQVRELQAMMMAVSLRCGASGISIYEDYNGFVRANMATLNAASTTLHAHFAEGGDSGQAGYDRFTTELSNRYGSGHTSAASCAAIAEIATRAASAAGTTGGLALFAAEMIPQPHFAGDRCVAPVVAAAPEASAGTALAMGQR